MKAERNSEFAVIPFSSRSRDERMENHDTPRAANSRGYRWKRVNKVKFAIFGHILPMSL